MCIKAKTYICLPFPAEPCRLALLMCTKILLPNCKYWISDSMHAHTHTHTCTHTPHDTLAACQWLDLSQLQYPCVGGTQSHGTETLGGSHEAITCSRDSPPTQYKLASMHSRGNPQTNVIIKSASECLSLANSSSHSAMCSCLWEHIWFFSLAKSRHPSSLTSDMHKGSLPKISLLVLTVLAAAHKPYDRGDQPLSRSEAVDWKVSRREKKLLQLQCRGRQWRKLLHREYIDIP